MDPMISEPVPAKLHANIEETTFPVPETYFADKTYDESLSDELKASYEALS